MVSPTAAGRTDSPTTSLSAVLPDEHRDLERYGFDDWSGASKMFWPTGPPQRGMRGVGGKFAPPGSSQSCPRSGVSFRLPLTRPPSSPDKPWSSMAAYRARRRARSLIISPQQSVTEV